MASKALFPPLGISVTLTLLMLAGGCVTSKPKPTAQAPAPPAPAPIEKPSYHPGNCGEFCGVIHACASMAHHEDLAGLLCGISRCETGNKCRGNLDSPNGLYLGPFQFLPQTWNAQCRPIFSRKHIAGCSGPGSIHDTCCSTICAAEIVAQGGIQNWPVCGIRAEGRHHRRKRTG